MAVYDPGVRAPHTVDAFLKSQQLIVTFDGMLEGKVDRVLAKSGLQRDVQLGTTRFATLPYIVKGTTRVASVPELVGRVLAQTHGLAFCPLAIDVPPGRPMLAWRRRSERDPPGNGSARSSQLAYEIGWQRFGWLPDDNTGYDGLFRVAGCLTRLRSVNRNAAGQVGLQYSGHWGKPGFTLCGLRVG